MLLVKTSSQDGIRIMLKQDPLPIIKLPYLLTQPTLLIIMMLIGGMVTYDTGVTGNITHTYATAGTYTIEISGTFPSIYFNDENGQR